MGAIKNLAIELSLGMDEAESPVASLRTSDFEVHLSRSLVDGVPYLQIDTCEPGSVRVDLNDGNIWDGDPEEDVPALLDGFAVALGTCKTNGSSDFTYPILTCTYCREALTQGPAKLRAYVAAARAHAATCAPQPKTTTLEGVTL